MKLAKYLADYIEHERENQGYEFDCFMDAAIIQQGIEAFASTEDASIVIQTNGDNIPMERY